MSNKRVYEVCSLSNLWRWSDNSHHSPLSVGPATVLLSIITTSVPLPCVPTVHLLPLLLKTSGVPYLSRKWRKGFDLTWSGLSWVRNYAMYLARWGVQWVCGSNHNVFIISVCLVLLLLYFLLLYPLISTSFKCKNSIDLEPLTYAHSFMSALLEYCYFCLDIVICMFWEINNSFLFLLKCIELNSHIQKLTVTPNTRALFCVEWPFLINVFKLNLLREH